MNPVAKKEPKPKTEKVKRCRWPTGCMVEATFSVIDFGFNPPPVRQLCKTHTDAIMKTERNYAVKEAIKL